MRYGCIHTLSLSLKHTRSRPKAIFDMDTHTHTLSHTQKYTEQAQDDIRYGHTHSLSHTQT